MSREVLRLAGLVALLPGLLLPGTVLHSEARSLLCQLVGLAWRVWPWLLLLVLLVAGVAWLQQRRWPWLLLELLQQGSSDRLLASKLPT